jgi:hypothetical protein
MALPRSLLLHRKPVAQKARASKDCPAKGRVSTFCAEESPPPPPGTKKLKALFQRAFDKLPNEDGWVHLGPLGSTLKNLDPKFESSAYGYKTLPVLVRTRTDLFEVRDDKKHSTVYVRLKKG